MPVFAELLHEDLRLNGIRMTVEGLEFQSEVLQQSFPVLSVCLPLTLCVPCLLGFVPCLYDFSIMKCHLSVKTGLIKYIPSKYV